MITLVATTVAEGAMAVVRWKPEVKVSRQETYLLKRCQKKRRLFAFLREQRHLLFDDAFQQELEAMYRNTGAGREPRCPAMMAAALILQGYLGVSDADAVELSVADLRWQMVLGCMGEETPPFSQGALFEFRERLIAHDMDRRLLERTAEIARSTKGFDATKLPKALRIAIDSSPLQGAGRVEDTLNLIGACTKARKGRGRSVSIARDERLQKRLRLAAKTKSGRQRFRERVAVEHSLAHLSQRQGNRARYRGVRKNLFDVRRASAIQNLEIVHRRAA